MADITYEYVSAGSPVIMYEKVNGFLVNEYTAYIDKHGNHWTLYPKRSIRPSYAVKFTKKTVSIRHVTILPPKKLIPVRSESAPVTEDTKKPDEQQSLF